MNITKHNIEKLGFKFVLNHEFDDSDYTFDKPSKREGWTDLLVWQPKDNNRIYLSQHTPQLREVLFRGQLYPGTKVEDYIVALFDDNFNSIEELASKLKEYDLISSL